MPKALLILAIFALAACEKSNTAYQNVQVVVQNEHCSIGKLGGVNVVLNGAVIGATNAEGEFIVPTLTDADSLGLVDADFDFQLIHTGIVANHKKLLFSARKRQTAQDSAAIAFLASLQNGVGILPSIEGGNLVSTYDQALAVLAFCATGNQIEAKGILDYFDSKRTSELEIGLGGFHQFRSPSGIPTGNRWMGDNAWLAIAIQVYQATFPQESGRYGELENSLINWLGSLKDPKGEGLYGGYLPNGDTIHKVTEGNIDAFAVFPDHYPEKEWRVSILEHLHKDKWDAKEKNLMAWPSNPQYKYALDCYTWAYMAFPDFPETARTYLDKFKVTATSAVTGQTISGYCFDEDQDVVWFEGTGQVAVMHWAAGDAIAAKSVLNELSKGWIQTANGEQGLPYSANQGTSYGGDELWSTASTDPCISSTAWYLMASYRFNPMVISKYRSISEEHMFWK